MWRQTWKLWCISVSWFSVGLYAASRVLIEITALVARFLQIHILTSLYQFLLPYFSSRFGPIITQLPEPIWYNKFPYFCIWNWAYCSHLKMFKLSHLQFVDWTTWPCLMHALRPTRSLRSRCGNDNIIDHVILEKQTETDWFSKKTNQFQPKIFNFNRLFCKSRRKNVKK